MLPRIGSLAFGFAVLIAFTYITGVGPVERVLLQVNPIATSIVGLVILLYLSFSPWRLQPSLGRVLRFVQFSIRAVQKEVMVDGKADKFLKKYHSNFRKMLVSKVLIALSFAASVGDWASSVMILWVVPTHTTQQKRLNTPEPTTT